MASRVPMVLKRGMCGALSTTVTFCGCRSRTVSESASVSAFTLSSAKPGTAIQATARITATAIRKNLFTSSPMWLQA